jgi:tRNA A-37 threonylcarbamoyl transferase component Bud32
MSEQVSVEVSAGGRPVAVKRAADSDRRERLRHEAAMLERAKHPGVVELVEIRDGDDDTSLSTAWVGGGSLASAALAPKRLAGIGASLATTVADLHDRGVVHRRLTPEHVLLDGLGRVVLIGFAEASSPPTDTQTADDVAAVGALLDAKVPTDLAAIARLRTSAAERDVIERLRAVLARARDPEPSRRPSARALSGLLAEIAGEQIGAGPIRLPRPTSADGAAAVAPHPFVPAYAAARAALGQMKPRLATRTGAILLALTATLIVGFGARAALASGAPSERATSDESPVTPEGTPTTTLTPTSITSPRVWPTSVACPQLALPGDRRDVDGDGCPEAVTVDGTQVVVDGVRYDVGAPGDAIAVADWDCDGTDTPAVLRPSTGDVFVFDGWATAESPVPARLLDRVSGAVALATPDGICDAVPVVDSAGTRSSVPLTVDALGADEGR